MDRRRLKYAEEQVVPEPFDLHILAGDDTEVQQHIVSHRQLYEMAGISFSGGKERCSYPKADSDVAETTETEGATQHILKIFYYLSFPFFPFLLNNKDDK